MFLIGLAGAGLHLRAATTVSPNFSRAAMGALPDKRA
jgi:hypothetical protein